ncbi:MAG: helicase-related protein [bacterium]|nr:helicase-related protein [bacterium]
MAKFSLTPDLVAEILARIPEGFVDRSQLTDDRQQGWRGDAAVKQAVENGKVGREGSFLFDKNRLSQEQVREYSTWCRPALPLILPDGKFAQPSIWERRKRRSKQFDNPAYDRLFNLLAAGRGYLTPDDIAGMPGEEAILLNLVHAGALDEMGGYVYDPLLVSPSTIEDILRKQYLKPLNADIIAYLNQKPGGTAPVSELVMRFNDESFDDAVSLGGLVRFSVQAHEESAASEWMRLESASEDQALKLARKTIKIADEAWEEAVQFAGTVKRPGIPDGKSRRLRVLARSYTLKMAAERLGISLEALEMAIHEGRLSPFTDPEGAARLSAGVIEDALADAAYLEQLTGFEPLKIREIAAALDLSYPLARKKLQRANLGQRGTVRWSDIRGRWGLPNTLSAFRTLVNSRLETRQMERQENIAERERLLMEQRRVLQEERHRVRRERDELRAKLVAAFPAWRHEGRADQRITLHVGPPNSGKTHLALDALAAANSGWYLAPLRLLAFEIFDRLNRRGVLCNLLTGEEYIPIPGATITAATIEMFDAQHSGDVVIIDEAQMLADPDRGWAWTRAIMEAEAPDIRVICPPTAQKLIEQMAKAAAMPIKVIEHERLAPIQVAKRHWPLRDLPPRTILVAFSRQNVLQLKTELERMQRTVSVIYGNLPPEVRRKQADRFASGQTDICVATDAVGMGLNLPADHVCFYELQKFDGKKVRTLTPSEVQQIGGRAGRYGLSSAGEVGATNKRDLSLVRQLFTAPQASLTHARVAPTVDDLEMIPGNLAEKLAQWSSLQSVPESLRSAIKTADLSERIELARMLTNAEVDFLGLSTAMRLINAPTRQSTRPYWYKCARAILSSKSMPLPPEAPDGVVSAADLELIESCVSCADIYLWLASRQEFTAFAPDADAVRAARTEWSERIDQALLERIDTARRCSQCGRPLSPTYRYSMCETCYQRRFEYDDDVEYDYR